MVGALHELEALRHRAGRVVEALRVGGEVVRWALVAAGGDVERRDRQARRERPGVHTTRDGGRRGERGDPRNGWPHGGAGDDGGDAPERRSREDDVPRAEGPRGPYCGGVVRPEPAVVDATLREAVTAEVEGEDPDAARSEPPRLREPLAEAPVRLVRQHHGGSRAGSEAAEAVSDEPDAVGRREPQLVAANAVV